MSSFVGSPVIVRYFVGTNPYGSLRETIVLSVELVNLFSTLVFMLMHLWIIVRHIRFLVIFLENLNLIEFFRGFHFEGCFTLSSNDLINQEFWVIISLLIFVPICTAVSFTSIHSQKNVKSVLSSSKCPITSQEYGKRSLWRLARKILN